MASYPLGCSLARWGEFEVDWCDTNGWWCNRLPTTTSECLAADARLPWFSHKLECFGAWGKSWTPIWGFSRQQQLLWCEIHRLIYWFKLQVAGCQTQSTADVFSQSLVPYSGPIRAKSIRERVASKSDSKDAQFDELLEFPAVNILQHLVRFPLSWYQRRWLSRFSWA